MKNLIARFVRETEGQDLIEYALLGALITIGSITMITSIGTKVTAKFTALDGVPLASESTGLDVGRVGVTDPPGGDIGSDSEDSEL